MTNTTKKTMKHYIGTKQVMAEPMNEQAANPDGSTYDSWSPKQVFEQSYRVSETFLDRMHIEHDELNVRCNKLEAFTHTDKFCELGSIQQGLLMHQLNAMQQYREWLAQRIENCGDKA